MPLFKKQNSVHLSVVRYAECDGSPFYLEYRQLSPALNGDVSNLRAIKEREKNFKRPEE